MLPWPLGALPPPGSMHGPAHPAQAGMSQAPENTARSWKEAQRHTRATVPVWLNRSGDPQPPPPRQYDTIGNTLISGSIIPACAAVLLIYLYLLGRLALDRHRLARWVSAWAATGPQWTSRE
jgi:hypothetical protein